MAEEAAVELGPEWKKFAGFLVVVEEAAVDIRS